MAKISVLVADDNAPIREMLSVVLRPHFTLFEPVENGRQLIEAVRAAEPDVVVSDVRMPVLDGLEAMRILRELGWTTPFVMVSADTEVAAQCLKAGAARFVPKEDVGRGLVPAVRSAVHSREWDSSTRADGDLRARRLGLLPRY